jgi:inner membrane protein
MDSLSQLALGAAVGVAVMGRRTAVWKAALWGGVCGTLPDLDALVDFGDPVLNMVLHRSDTHALLWLALLSPALGALVARLHGERAQWRHWSLAVALALLTHPLLDAVTIYGTQLLRPFTDEPVGLGSLFIIDPAYTLPLLVGVIVALVRRNAGGWRWNLGGLALSTAYIAWSAAAQLHVKDVAREALARQGLPAAQLFVTPTPFNTVLWRVVALDGTHVHEGFWGFLDGRREIVFERYPQGTALLQQLDGGPHANDRLQRIVRFSDGFYRLREVDGRLQVADLRMGQHPNFVFEFAVARREGASLVAMPPEEAGGRGDFGPALDWLGRRIRGEPVPPPR